MKKKEQKLYLILDFIPTIILKNRISPSNTKKLIKLILFCKNMFYVIYLQ